MPHVEDKSSILPVTNKALEFVALFALALIAHAVVLQFIFPGYYDPLWPLHSDFYLPTNISNSGLGVLNYLSKPRPSGMAFFFLIGRFGVHGSIAAIIFVTLMNVAMTATIAKNLLNISFNFQFLATYIIYIFLLFSHPYFYSFYAHDAFSQLSYFFLLIGVLFYSFFFKKSFKISVLLLFIFSLLAFLAKETFGLAAIAVSLVWLLYHQKKSVKEAIAPTASVFLALCIVFIYSFTIKSAFITNSNDAYRVEFNPLSIMSNWFEYVSLGYNVASLVGLLLIGALVWYKFQVKNKSSVFFYAACLLGFIAALLPNSLLASHVHPGYSWTGAYLSFAIIFLVASPHIIHGWKRPQIGLFIGLLLMVGFISHVVNIKKYSSSANQWVLIQEDIQRNLLNSLKMLVEDLDEKESEHILITGISFPYEPFHYGNSLNNYLSNYDVKIDVLSYSQESTATQRGKYISKIPVSNELDLSKYSRIWLFGNDGRFIYLFKNEKINDLFPLKKYILFPEVGDVLGVNFLSFTSDDSLTSFADGYKLLNAGNTYLIYQQTDLAINAYKQSARLIPDNPYPWYMIGIELEKQNKLEEAKTYLNKAVELDPGNLNENFRSALMRVTSHK
ncbi:tetratricopeptide repeat protein [Cellvibrio fibrivorans]|uniref:Tetratricopeptide (TPR) repeat protein n=1 Tax=Cellvibrio fibrivorans TaxID=126350 RepID=A0ABU1UU52_9GAMM|nr:tetratricopeptide repeat protein [Cellvibrio fibrivorans]MDR7088685.1 tetratricopeptide (TPR) repeat protein [Cellvibrio fibrivorans]